MKVADEAVRQLRGGRPAGAAVRPASAGRLLAGRDILPGALNEAPVTRKAGGSGRHHSGSSPAPSCTLLMLLSISVPDLPTCGGGDRH